MPTAAKLFAALAMAATGFLAAEFFKPGMTAGTQFGPFSLIVAGIGALTGWIVLGGLGGKGYAAAAGSGLRTSVTMVFWALLLFSIIEMIKLATKMRYDGPMEAIIGVFRLMMDYGQLVLQPMVLAALGVGGMMAGCLMEWAGRRWR